jgi:hypothetical protein
MKEKVRFLGLDVRAETIAVAVAEQNGEVRSLEVTCVSGERPGQVETGHSSMIATSAVQR